GALDYRAYFGTMFFDVSQSSTPLQLDVPYVGGGRLLWETPLEGLRLGGSVQALKLEGSFVDPRDPAPVTFELPALLTVASVDYGAEDLRVVAEYSRWWIDLESSNQMLFPDSSTVSERAYAMVTYRVKHWFQPGAYYSMLFPDI